jgi:drug/metabolite transporter (DMT)-like permease
MNHLPFTLLAYLLNALAVLANKFLLNKAIPDPLVYVFYISVVSIFAVLVIPFTNIPSFVTFNVASLSTVLWTLGAYFMFKALKIGHVSRVIPIIGTLIPLFLLIFAVGTGTITAAQTWAVWFLVAGIIFLTITDWQGKFSIREIVFELLSAGLFALSYLFLRQAYLSLDFFSVLVWSRLILLPLCLTMLIIPALRRKIITSNGLKINFFSKPGLVFLGGQLSGAASEFLLLFSISLANPALVNSLQGTQYVFLLIFALVLGREYPKVFEEKYTLLTLAPKLVGIILIGLGLFSLSIS